jgi:6-phosphogluconolactonase
MEQNPQALFVYIGTYTERMPHVAGKAEGIYVYRLDPTSGALTYVSRAAGTINPSFLALSPRKDRLYAVNELTEDLGPHGTVSAFAIDPATKGLSFLNKRSTHGLAPCYVSVDRTGRYVLVANYLGGNVCVLPVVEDGRLGEATAVVGHQGSGPHPHQDGPHAHSIMPDLHNGYVIALDLGTDQILVYRLDLARGTLAPGDSPGVQLAPGSGPRHLAFHPAGAFAYAINELNSTITTFAYDHERGALETLQTVSTLPEDFSGQNYCADVQVAPSGRFVYGSNRGHDSIAIFAVDRETGRLSTVGHEPTGGATPRNFVIDPTGTFLLVANQDSDTVVTFRVDQETGKLVATGHVAQVPTPVCLRTLKAS